MKRVIVATMLLLMSLSGSAGTYSVVDLGTLGGAQSFAFAINNNQQTVGWSLTSADQTMAFTMPDYKWIMTDLGTLYNANNSSANAINNSGQITGQYMVNGYFHGFLLTNNTWTDLGTIGGLTVQAFGINDSGSVVGMAGVNGGIVPLHAFSYVNGVIRDIGTLGGTNSGANDINNNGVIVGEAYTSANNGYHAFRYANNQMSNLGLGANSFARSINDSNKIVGNYSVNGYSHAYIYTNGVTTDLGILSGFQNSAAYGINNNGVVVGTSYNDNDPNDGNAFVYANGIMTDLNSLIDQSSGWVLNIARGINDSGNIVGIGKLNGITRGFRLAPNPVITSMSATSGKAGDIITIYGTNLCDPNPQYPTLFCNSSWKGYVKFGTVFAKTLYVYPTFLQVRVPTGAVSAPVKIFTPYTSAQSPMFTIQ